MNYNRVADSRNEKDINVADGAWFASSFGSSPKKTAKLATRTRTDDISSGSFGRTELMGQNIIRGYESNLEREDRKLRMDKRRIGKLHEISKVLDIRGSFNQFVSWLGRT